VAVSGCFAGQCGGEFFTPRSVVRLMVEIIEPHQGTVFDPACGSGGMFVQSAHFVEQRANGHHKDDSLFVYGQEKTLETVKLAKMNLAVNGLRGDIKQAISYYEDPFDSFETFDYVLANPPFNVDEVSLNRVENDVRFNTYGIPRNKTKTKKKGDTTVPNANYLWINLFATSLKPTGRAGLVMANSASDARHSEADIRRTLIEHNLIYAMVTLPSNMFYTVTLPATLWFFDKAKADERILFIDARNVFTQIDRAHREFSEEQIQDIATIARLQRGDNQAFVSLVDSYLDQGMAKVKENQERLKTVAQAVTDFIKGLNGKDLPDFAPALAQVKSVKKAYIAYQKNLDLTKVTPANKKQHKLSQQAAPLFADLHALLKAIDKKVRHLEKEQAKVKDKAKAKDLKALKQDLAELHREVAETEYFFTHVTWLQERFPAAKYEDVTGLCKLADLADIKEQDYSLNPGRYVGVVIEEDGKTEEEFIADILELNDELTQLNKEARKLEKVIAKNVAQIGGEE
jgi:type I restriction enzyme M protein